MAAMNMRHRLSTSPPADRDADRPGERSTTMQSSLASRNPLVLLWLPFILALVIFIGQELSASATSIAAARDADSEVVLTLQAALAEHAATEVSRSVGLMDGASGEGSPLQASGTNVEVSRSVGLMTGAPDRISAPFVGGMLDEAHRANGLA